MKQPDENSGASDERRKVPARFLFALFLCLASFYSIFVRGTPPNGDPVNYFVVAQSIAEKGTEALDKNDYVPLEKGRDGAYYSKFGIGQSLLETPFCFVAKILAPPSSSAQRTPDYNYFFKYFMAELSVSFAAALACVFFLLIVLEFGYSLRVALATTATLALATLMWSYAKVGFSEALQACALTAAFLYAVRSQHGGRLLAAAAHKCGICLGVLFLTKASEGILVLFFIAFLLYKWRKEPVRTVIAKVLSVSLPIAEFFLVAILYNHERFGEWLNFGYFSGRDSEFGFSTPVLAGLYGFLFSPGKSIFIYMPVIVLALIGAGSFHRRRRAESALVWVCVTATLLLYSRWWAWHGDWCWGPRFLVPVVPLAMLPLSEIFESFKSMKLISKAAVAAVIALSFLIQVTAVSADYYAYIFIVRHQVPYTNKFYMPGREGLRDDLMYEHFVPDFSPVAGQWWLFKNTLMGHRPGDAASDEAMRKDFPWRGQMGYAPPPDPSIGLGFNFWWVTFPQLFQTSKTWVFPSLAIIFIFCAGSLYYIKLMMRGKMR